MTFIRMTFMTCHDIDLVTFHFITEHGSRLVEHDALTQLARPLLHIIFVEVQFFGNLWVRQSVGWRD